MKTIALSFFSFLWVLTACDVPKAASDTTQSDLPVFSCYGNEPFWNISIAQQGITYRSADGPKIEYPFFPPRENGPSLIFETQRSEGGKIQTLKIVILRQNCLDSMSGERFPFTADVEKDGKILYGCAK